MLKNYLLVALRTLRRQKGYTSINMLGLATGVACCLFLLLYVRDELSYDRYHEHADEIYRVNLAIPEVGRIIALTPTIIAPLLKREFPEVEAATRIEANGGLINYGDQTFDERAFYYADSTVFDVFTFPLILGDEATALVRPNTVVITESTARKYFGNADPLGKTLKRNNDQEYEITGVMTDLPANSHLQFDFLASFASRQYWASNEIWGSANFYTFVRLGNQDQLPGLERKAADLLAALRASGAEPRDFELQPLTKIHLTSGIEYELDSSGDMTYVVGFSTLAVLILLMACINYMNLSTARSTLRSKEIGLRKSLGAFRQQLVGQFYGEAVLLTFGALVAAFGIVSAGLPWFNSLSGKALVISDLFSPAILALAAAVFILVGLVAGSYPALFLSALKPVRALRGQSTAGRGSARIREGLVVVQFGISAFLIVATLVVIGQLKFMQNENLGFDKEHIVELQMNDPTLFQSYSSIRDAMADNPSIVAVSAVNQIPGQLGWTSRFRAAGMSEDEEFLIKGMPSETGVVDALGLELLAGTAFPTTIALPDSVNYQFILNETTISRLGWTPDEAIGRRVSVPPRDGTVIGVVKDFNYNSMHVAIEPLAIWYQPNEIRRYVARIKPGQTEAAIEHIRRTWIDFAPSVPFSYRFIDDIYDRLYADEERMSNVMKVFALLAIGVACLGLLGLASFTVDKRTREIGVRKVLGASVTDIVGLLSKDFLLLVGIAFVLAIPATLFVLSRWLGGFAYRITPGPGMFAIAAFAILAIALLTVSSQAIRAATADPTKSLRYD